MQADYIIVGGGSAGCVLANRLSENPDVNVTLVEAGSEDWNPLIHIPAGYIKTMVNPNVNWMFNTAPDIRTADRKIAMPRGKVLGGSSAINAMLYVRGQAEDYDTWEARGNAGWSYADVLPYFKKSENCQIASLTGAENVAFHGTDGPLKVNAIRSTYPILDRLIEAAQSLQFPMNADYNGETQEGFGYYQLTQSRGLRFSAKKAYLAPVRRRPNLTVLTKCQVIGLDIDHTKTARGVYVVRGGQRQNLRANREVILSAGAIQSPQLLELSGIGNPQILQKHGLAVLHPLNGVGAHLADHYISRLSWQLSADLSINKNARGLRLLGEILRFGMTRRGTLSLPAGMLAGFVKSDPSQPRPDVQYHIANASFENPAERVFDRFPGLTIGPCQLRPFSRGHVHIQSPNPLDAPLIVPNYLEDQRDQSVHIAGMKIARDLMATPIMSQWVDREIAPGIDRMSDADLLSYALATGVTLYHPVSTCRMGPSPNSGDVVDARLRVHGVHNLRVVDASIMPELISGNTNAPTIMIAEKAADMIKADAAALKAALPSSNLLGCDA